MTNLFLGEIELACKSCLKGVVVIQSRAAKQTLSTPPKHQQIIRAGNVDTELRQNTRFSKPIMSEDFDDLFADNASSPPYESNDYQFLTPMIPSGAVHKAENTDTLKDSDFDWFNDDRNLEVRNTHHLLNKQIFFNNFM